MAASNPDIALPVDKLSLGFIEKGGLSSSESKQKLYVVLVSTGSFNPPTYMHLRCFVSMRLTSLRHAPRLAPEAMEARIDLLARDALSSKGFCVIGGYMSPVNDSYRKKGLIQAAHRIAMCYLACKSSDFVMLDPWEKWLKVLLVCGSDLLESFSVPGFWVRGQVETICRDFGLVCIRRGCQDVESIISKDDILNEYKKNITIVDEVVPNGISSTGLRDCISRGLSVKYLTADEVIDYIKQNGLYMEQN
ncbi:hypothetical protein OROMI_027433 [Orobanche minor]